MCARACGVALRLFSIKDPSKWLLGYSLVYVQLSSDADQCNNGTCVCVGVCVNVPILDCGRSRERWGGMRGWRKFLARGGYNGRSGCAACARGEYTDAEIARGGEDMESEESEDSSRPTIKQGLETLFSTQNLVPERRKCLGVPFPAEFEREAF